MYINNITNNQQCISCLNFRGGEVPSCRAFPEGIPDEIYIEGRDHTKPYPGDEGVRFKPMPD